MFKKTFSKLPVWITEAVYGSIFGLIISGIAFLVLSRESAPSQLPVLLPTIFLSMPGIFVADKFFNGSVFAGIVTVTIWYGTAAALLAYIYRKGNRKK